MAHYLDNKLYTRLLGDYALSVRQAKAANTTPPQMSDALARMIMTISRKLSDKANFRFYSNKEDMVMEGMLACLKYIDHFDASFGTSGLSYTTQIVKNAFLRAITVQNDRMYRNMMMSEQLATHKVDRDYQRETNKHHDPTQKDGPAKNQAVETFENKK